jgi:MoaA/NifB/PqqE/SkfB family radical SAM enzyme
MMDLRQLRDLARAKKLPPPKEFAWNFIKYNYLQPFWGVPFLPKSLLVYVTYRCNARCVMCGIWQDHEFSDAKTELSLDDLERTLSDPLFCEIEYVNINGGEPTLRRDLVDIVQLLMEKLPHLKHLSMNSNGLLPGRLASSVEQILTICRHRDIYFSLVISCHGIEGLLDKMLGVPGAFDRLERTLKALRELDGHNNRFLSLNCVITNINVSNLYELLEWCNQQGIHINFIMGEVRDRFFNQGMAAQTAVSGERKKEAIDFLRRLAQDKSLTNPVALRYHRLANMLEHGDKRRMACHYAMGGIIIGSHGDLYYCKHSRAIGNCREGSAYEIYYDEGNLDYRQSRLVREKCLYCVPNTFNRLEFQKDLLRFLRFLINPQ